MSPSVVDGVVVPKQNENVVWLVQANLASSLQTLQAVASAAVQSGEDAVQMVADAAEQTVPLGQVLIELLAAPMIDLLYFSFIGHFG